MKLKYVLSDLVFPPRCILCNQVISQNEVLCGDCKASKNFDPIPFVLDNRYNGVAVCKYEGVYRSALFNFKFKNKKYYGRGMGILIGNAISSVFPNIKFDFITCVPLSKKRLKERGYNQSQVIAKSISEHIKIPYKDFLIKPIDNRVQHTLSRKERVYNIKGAYKCISEEVIRGKTILLTDDVTTTGTTFKECSNVLMSAGAQNVYCCSFSKT